MPLLAGHVAGVLESADDIAARIESTHGVFGERDISPFAFDHVTDLGPFVLIHLIAGVGLGGEAANFKDQQGVAVVVDGHERVGGLAVIDISKSSADRQDGWSDRGFAQSQAGEVMLCAPWLAMSPLPVSQNQCQS